MNHDEEVKCIKHLQRLIKEGRTSDSGKIIKIPLSYYNDKDIAQQEWQQFFLGYPQIIGLSCDLPNKNSFFTCDDFGVPILATRDATGKFHAFVNSCRHRGAQVACKTKGEQDKFSCPYHNWTYSNEGKLTFIPEEEQFGEVNKDALSLISLPAKEKHGLLWVTPSVNGELDVDTLLGGMVEDIAALELKDYVFMTQHEEKRASNWKLANNTFGENYHFNKLHKSTFGNLSIANVQLTDYFDLNTRWIIPNISFVKANKLNESDWDIRKVCSIVYYLFPNIQIVCERNIVGLWQMFPVPSDPAQCSVRFRLYFSKELLELIKNENESASPMLRDVKDNFHPENRKSKLPSVDALLQANIDVVFKEDLLMGEMIQRSANARELEYNIIGKNEGLVQYWNANFRALMGLHPLEEYSDPENDA